MDQYSMEGKNNCSTTRRSYQDSGHIDATREDCSQSTDDVLQIGCCYDDQFARRLFGLRNEDQAGKRDEVNF